MIVEFKPCRRADGKFAIEIFRDDVSLGFVMWIDTTDRKLCIGSRADMVPYPRWTKKETQANCNWMNAAYVRGDIR